MALSFPRWQLFRRAEPAAPTTNPQLRAMSSPTFERHIRTLDLEEMAARSASSRTRGPQNRSLAWDEAEALGIPADARRTGLLSERDRKDTLYKAYLNNPWVGACVDVIAKRITSGGWEVEPVEQGKGNESDRDALKALLLFVNDDEDFLQFLRAIIMDLLIYGEAYCEIVYGANGIPVQLHKIDCLTMNYQLDEHGQIVGYSQSLEKSTESISLSVEQVIRWWLPDPRASKKALSPIERIKDAIYLHQAMTNWSIKFFRQGAKPSFSVEMGPDSSVDDAQRFIKFFKENYTGIANAHVPPVMYNGSKLQEFGHGSVDVDFLNGLKLATQEILAGFGVPPALVGIIESGNIGGGTGESQEKSFQYNVADPIKQLVLEKLNYRLQKAFGTQDWVITTRYADFRSDDAIAKIQDIQVRNGTLSINEARQERGRAPVEGGDDPIIVTGKDLTPVARLADMIDEQRQQAQFAMVGMQQAAKQQQEKSDNEEEADTPFGKPSAKKQDGATEQAWRVWTTERDTDFFVKAAVSGGVPNSSRKR